jgi:hypothetical protein
MEDATKILAMAQTHFLEALRGRLSHTARGRVYLTYRVLAFARKRDETATMQHDRRETQSDKYSLSFAVTTQIATAAEVG